MTVLECIGLVLVGIWQVRQIKDLVYKRRVV